jgi:hypothetical protein
MGSRAFCIRPWDSPHFVDSDLDEVFRDERAIFLVIEIHFTLLPASPIRCGNLEIKHHDGDDGGNSHRERMRPCVRV